ncbi:hypothetical protein NH340_JMT07113 [Sarcoptes scabiei]|nr:hypothetical protein NH340_JMT07113 [Sarcoptes scabiei]
MLDRSIDFSGLKINHQRDRDDESDSIYLIENKRAMMKIGNNHNKMSQNFLRRSVVMNRTKSTALVFTIFIILIILYYEREISRLTEMNRIDYERYRMRKKSPSRLKISNDDVNSDDGTSRKISEPLMVVYNRVPKTGSTSFMGIVYDLCNENRFNVMHLNTTKNSHVISLSDQIRFVRNVTRWYERQPLLIHGHIAFVNFQRFSLTSTKPLYINIIRKPIDRLVSYYYFLRFGDNFRPNVIRRRQGNKRTFDECIEHNEHDCRLENLWLQIPFFCGQNPDCWKPGNRWALEQAKKNLIDHYFLVGVTEAMEDFIRILEISLPEMFSGATFLYQNGSKSHLRKTFNKTQPSPRTIAKIQQSRIWQMENDFYQFVLYNFKSIQDRINLNQIKFQDEHGRSLYRDRQQFFFEKIRPRQPMQSK